MTYTTARAAWESMSSKHGAVLRRAQRCAKLTLRHLLQPDTHDADFGETPNIGSNFGAQVVNSLVGKLVQGLFSPTAPVGRLTASQEATQKLAGVLGVTELDNVLAAAEVRARDEVAGTGARARLFTALTHVLICGNYLLDLDTSNKRARGYGLEHYRIRRTIDQAVHTLVIKECLQGGELHAEVRAQLGIDIDSTKEYSCFVWVRLLESGDYEESHWVDDTCVESLTRTYKPEDQHFHPLHWSLPDDRDYGVGLVEQYLFDFETHLLISKALAEGSALAGEFRWLVSPGGIATIDQLNSSTNGSAIAGKRDDVVGTSLADSTKVRPLVEILQVWEARIARGFLYVAPQIRQAERVTAEELRMLVDELDQAYGGAYTTLADTIVKPLLLWGLRLAGLWDAKANLKLTVVSGAEALSRNADLQRLTQGLNILSNSMSGTLGGRLNLDKLALRVGALLGVDLAQFIVAQTAPESNSAQGAALNMQSRQGA